jgi:hypothetical protein
MVSSISRLLCVVGDASCPPPAFSNVCATDEPGRRHIARRGLLSCLVTVALFAQAQLATAQTEESVRHVNRTAAIGGFLGGVVVGLGAHEGGHVLFDVIFDADPGLKRIEFHGIPFFAITHESGLPPRQEFAISSAGFWVQHATNEWLLTKTPRLREHASPFTKGVFTFNVGVSAMYSIAAFAQTGPDERDTLGMAVSSRVSEPWIGALVLGPAALDTWRYFKPEARWPVWLSRAMKIGGVLLILR